MILYSVERGRYILPVPPKIYINLTNRCNNSCTFCLRNLKTDGLWLDHEPTDIEIISALQQVDLLNFEEVIFCGYGEPTLRLDVLLQVLQFIKSNFNLATRLNTNGLGSLQHHRDISADFAGLLDCVSISLNASTAEKYFEITRSRFGLKAFPALLDFAKSMKNFCNVVMTVVDVVTPKDEILRCKEICASLGVNFRLREYEGD